MDKGYWILTISEDNMQIVLQCNVIGMPSRRGSLVRMINDGDIIIFYIGKKRAGYGGTYPTILEFGPVAKVIGDTFYDETEVWNSRVGERYPWRRNISILLDGRVKVKEILGKLSFIKNTDRWGLYFIKGLRQVSKQDYILLKDAIESKK